MTCGLSDRPAAERDALVAAGAHVTGRTVFGTGRGPWDETGEGRRGEDPPVPVAITGSGT